MNTRNTLPELEIDELTEEAAKSGDRCQQQVNMAVEQHRRSIVSFVMDRKRARQVRESLSKELALGFDHRYKALAMALETRLHSIREACNHVLVTGKTHLRQQRIEYFGRVMQRLEQRMQEITEEFLQDMDRRYERLEKYRSSVIRAREEKRLDSCINNFLDTMDRLMDEFRNIIEEHVDHEGTGSSPKGGR